MKVIKLGSIGKERILADLRNFIIVYYHMNIRNIAERKGKASHLKTERLERLSQELRENLKRRKKTKSNSSEGHHRNYTEIMEKDGKN